MTQLFNTVEFAILFGDKTWGTVTEPVPASVGLETDALTGWADINLSQYFNDVAMFAVYHLPSDEETE